MTSPFSQAADELGRVVTDLPVTQQSRFFSCVSLAFLPAVRRWEKATRADQSIEERLVAAAEACVVHDARDAADLGELASVLARDTEGPQDGVESEDPDFIAALNAWICADVAVRLLLGDRITAGSAWYVLEPQFQATSERLFDVVDVGSADAVAGETAALSDPGLVAAVSAAHEVAARLGDQSISSSRAHDRLVETLGPICP